MKLSVFAIIFIILTIVVSCETEPYEPIVPPTMEDTTETDTTDTTGMVDTTGMNDTVNNDTVNNDTTGQPSCDTSDYTYSGFIVSVFSDNGCNGCHPASSGNGVSLNSYNNVKVVVDNGKLSGSLNHESGFSNMPQGGDKLDSCTLAKIELWINAGAPNN